MGCSQSKIENEEAVARCKDRKHFMKQAVSARNAFAAAHSSYATYLKSTGAALSDFAEGQVHFSQFPSSTTSSSAVPPPIAAAQQSSFKIPPPPPPLPPPLTDFAPLQRSVTMPEIKLTRPESNPVGTIIEEDEHDVELESESLRRGRRKKTATVEREEPLKQPPPPQPLQRTENVNRHLHHLESSSRDDHHDHVTQNSAWEYFFPAQENVPATNLKDAEEIEQQHQHQHQHQHHLENDEEEEEEDDDEEIHREVFEEKLPEEPVPVEVVAPPVVAAKELKKGKQPQQAAVSVAVEGIESGGKHQSVNLIQIFNDLDDHFLKASESAHEVSKMLEATRLHYHSNFADNRGSK